MTLLVASILIVFGFAFGLVATRMHQLLDHRVRLHLGRPLLTSPLARLPALVPWRGRRPRAGQEGGP
jgi:hypothetical protein